MNKIHFYEGMVPMPDDFDTLQSNAEEALGQSNAVLGVGVLEGLGLVFDASGGGLVVQAGKALSPKGHLLRLETAQRPAVPARLSGDSRVYQVVLRRKSETVVEAVTLRGEKTWKTRKEVTETLVVETAEADDLVLGEVKPDPQDGLKHVLDESARPVAKGWESLTETPFEVKDAFVSVNSGEKGAGITARSTSYTRRRGELISYHGGFSPRYEHTTAVYKDKLWVIGGSTNNGKTNDVWSFDGTRWTEKFKHDENTTSRFTPRARYATAVYQGKLWVIGGYTNNGYTNDVWSFDGSTWTEEFKHDSNTTSRFTPRDRHATAVYQGKLWVIGGDYKNDVWSFDGSIWTEEFKHDSNTTSRFTPRYDHATAVYQGKLWVIGGYTNDVWNFDGSTWTEEFKHDSNTASRFSPRDDHATAAYQNKLWVIGGYDNGQKNDVWSFDGSTWTEKFKHDSNTTSRFSPRERHTTAVYQNKLWVIGGCAAAGSYQNDVWAYDGKRWRDWEIKETAQRAEKPLSGLRVKRGSLEDSLLAYNEETHAWEIDGQEVLKLTGGMKAFVDFIRFHALNAIMPVGYIYAQFPGQWSPGSIFGSHTKWERLYNRGFWVSRSANSFTSAKVSLWRRVA